MRKRLIHPELARHEVLGTMSHSHRLLFAMLSMIADRQGRIEDRPRRIKADLFPYDPDDSIDVDGLLTDLDGAGFIVRYEANGKACIFLPGMRRWQKPHPREAESVLPPPPPGSDPRPTEGEPRLALGAPRKPDPDLDPDQDPPLPPRTAGGASGFRFPRSRRPKKPPEPECNYCRKPGHVLDACPEYQQQKAQEKLHG